MLAAPTGRYASGAPPSGERAELKGAAPAGRTVLSKKKKKSKDWREYGVGSSVAIIHAGLPCPGRVEIVGQCYLHMYLGLPNFRKVGALFR